MAGAGDNHRSSAAAGHTCDECAERGARYYCAADDAFLCSDCDSAVHSANSLARRHHRLRLKAFAKAPSWFTRKLRTPRPRHRRQNPKPSLVPNIEASGEEDDNDDERLLYRVPVLAEFQSPNTLIGELKTETATPDSAATGFVGFQPSETELMEFAADMESLLCPLRDSDVFSFEELGPKVEEDTAMFGIGFGNGSPGWTEETEKQKEAVAEAAGSGFCLRLDYEAVIAAWPHSGGSPWTDGERPRINLDDCWPWYKGILGGERQGLYGAVAAEGHVADVDREARVTRYREKRRTRLFSKKIRYEVRKLNAEKRPRIKGRFVKRPQAPTGPRFCLSRA